MKHDLGITLVLLALFLSAHLVGLLIVRHYLPEEQQLPLNIQKPQLEEQTSYLPIFLAILLASLLALLLIKFQALGLWKLWFFLSVIFTLTIAFASFLPQLLALGFALILAFFKIIKPNLIIHNFTEIFIYGGLAALFVPVLNLFSVILLLALISLYDMIAVWKTKHMISLAKFQSQSKIFAGLYLPYEKKKYITPLKITPTTTYKETRYIEKQAILGGGDIGFPLLFSGVILKYYGLIPAITVSVVTTFSLFVIFTLAEKQKFYPAMPFLTAGCLLGYGITYLLYL